MAQKRKTISLNPLRDIKSKAIVDKKPGLAIDTSNKATQVKKITTKSQSAATLAKKLPVKKTAEKSKATDKNKSGIVTPKVSTHLRINKGNQNPSGIVRDPAPSDEAVLNKTKSVQSEKIQNQKKATTPDKVNEIFDSELSLIASPTSDTLFSDGGSYAESQKIIIKWSKISLATIVLPNSILEYAAISGIQLKMLHEMSKSYGIPFKADAVKVIIGSILGGSVAYFLSDIYSGVVKQIPVIGKPISFISEPAMAYITTYAVGYVFLEHFENNGDFQNIEIEHIKRTINTKISEKYKEMIKGNKLMRPKRFFKTNKTPA